MVPFLVLRRDILASFDQKRFLAVFLVRGSSFVLDLNWAYILILNKMLQVVPRCDGNYTSDLHQFFLVEFLGQRNIFGFDPEKVNLRIQVLNQWVCWLSLLWM